MIAARKLSLVVCLSLGWLAPIWAEAPFYLAEAERTVYLARGLSAEQTLVLGANLAAARFPGVLLLHTPQAEKANLRFMEQFQPNTPIPIEPRAFTHGDRHVDWNDSSYLCGGLFPNAERIIVANTTSRRMLFQAAALAVASRAPLFLWRGVEDQRHVSEFVALRGTRELIVVGNRITWPDADNKRLTVLSDEAAVQAEAIKNQSAHGAIDTLILANPTDSGIADLAPWVMNHRRAVLILTNDKGDDASAAVRRAIAQPELRSVENLLLLARPAAIVPERRNNPVAGKDPYIEMEPFTPEGNEPYTFATGRLFHADPGIVALILARSRLLPQAGTPRTALVASDPGGSLPMLETFSHVSIRELKRSGYQTTSLLGDGLTPGQLRRRLPDADVFLWEGHHNTLIKDWGFSSWDEPLRPSLMFLQSCMALTEEKATPLFDRGALAVLGSSSRIYSATGGAFSLAYLDALLYDGESLGGALRQSKNFLLAYSLLKEKRLGSQAKLGGANMRSAWAFTLWGDPALKLPAPPIPEGSSAVRCRVRGDTITLSVPPVDGAEEVGKYRVAYRPNARLAGMIRPAADDEKKLVPFVFSEVRLPNGPEGTAPQLATKLADSSWTFVWDARRRVGYLLAMPRDGAHELKFQVSWAPASKPQAVGR